MREGPAEGRASHRPHPRPAMPRGTKDPSPKTEVFNQEPAREAGGVPSISRTIGS